VLAAGGARARRGRAQEERRRWEVECEQQGARGKARASDAEFIGREGLGFGKQGRGGASGWDSSLSSDCPREKQDWADERVP
jgi:hypothetical protein